MMRESSRRTSSLRFATIVCALLAVIWAIAQPTQAQDDEPVTRIKPAVVLISVKHVNGQAGRGSGFLYNSAGLVLTNHRVIEGAVEIIVRLPDKRSFQATVVDYVRREDYAGEELQMVTDAAVLKIDASDVPSLPLGDSDTLRQGQELLVFGYPGSVSTDEVTVARGTVSALRPGWVQTDAAIELENSGGPVVDRQGRVVGIATFTAGPNRMTGSAVAINGVRGVASSALNDGAPRIRDVMVTGMEYVVVRAGRRTVWRRSYNPGSTGQQGYVTEVTSEDLKVDDYNGALLVRARDSTGAESRSYLDSHGLLGLPVSQGGWVFASEPRLILPLPPFGGRTWQDRRTDQYPPQGLVRQLTSTTRIEGLNEVLTVPAGTYAQCMKVVETILQVDTRGGQRQVWHVTTTTWRAPSVGPIRTVRELGETKERFVQELVSKTP
jgi:S1-C subfamily serine protease